MLKEDRNQHAAGLLHPRTFSFSPLTCVLLAFAGLLISGCAHRHDQPRRVSWVWLALDAPTSASLRGLSVGERAVWASGQNGTVIRTTDGGGTWQIRSIPEAAELDLRDIDALDRNTALAMSAGSPARIFRTEDGGVTWRTVYRNDHPDVFLDGMAFRGQTGFAYGDPLEGCLLVLRSDDAGRTWTRIPCGQLPRHLSGEAGFAASGSGIVIPQPDQVIFGTGGGSAARLFSSGDAGETWTTTSLPLAAGSAARGVFSLACGAEGRVVAVGGDYLNPDTAEGTAAFSTDGGRTWQRAATPPGGYRSCVTSASCTPAYVSSSRADWPLFVAVGTNGADVSWDGGRTWKQAGTTGYHAIAFHAQSSIGFAVGADGAVARITLTARPASR